ncbi:MAG: hypothetical protein IT337_12710, partial [Thermomicrobiales bacterium]|nr:hypothetical protein [Thermomicrobiales bacterium]
GDEGLRRVYPRYAKDVALLPKIDLAIDYLDGMVGRRRGDLAAEAVLDLLGDPKLARCLLVCLADSYRYRAPGFAEILGDAAAARLAAAEVVTPADLRGLLYLETNRVADGFVAPAQREVFLTAWGQPRGLTAVQLGEALHLDAERNAILVRSGNRPRAEDVRARYNALLTLSVLRHASEIALDLPGVDPARVATICEREGVPARRDETGRWVVQGRRNALGTWSGFGARVARCVLRLVADAPKGVAGEAIVHLNAVPLRFLLDGFPLDALRPPDRAIGGPVGDLLMNRLHEAIAQRRRQGIGFGGWTVRRATEPIVLEGALLLPEAIFVRDSVSVALVSVADGPLDPERLAAAHATRPLIVLGGDGGGGAPALREPDGEALLRLLERIAVNSGAGRGPLAIVAAEVADAGWVSLARLTEVFGTEVLAERVSALTSTSDSAFVPDIGVLRSDVLGDLAARAALGDVAALRVAVGAAIGSGAAADALTLHLLTDAAWTQPTLPAPLAA